MAIIFDVDGVLLDTKEFILQAFEHTFSEHDLGAPTREQIQLVLGRSLTQMFEELAPGFDAEALTEEFRSFQARNLSQVESFPAAIETVTKLKESGLKIGALSSRKRFVAKTLQLTGLLDHIDVVLSGADVQRIKPDPEGIHTILDTFSVAPAQSIMVGDMVEDIGAGKNAGTKTAAALYGFGSASQLAAAQPDFQLPELGALLHAIDA